MKNALTIDVEDWYQTQDFNFHPNEWSRFESRIEYSMERLLDVLSSNRIHATFFILGNIAEKHTALVRKIAALGHEIGSHGYKHRMVSTLTSQEFSEDLLMSKNLLEDIIGKQVQYFRAPTWSICEKNLWALEILEENGFICDSSMQPFKTPLSGSNNIPATPFYPQINQKRLKLLEYPPTTKPFGTFRLPFAGGLYLRVLPYCFLNRALKKVNKESSGMVYIHPWELDTEQPRLKVPVHIKLSHYYNLGTTLPKINRLFEDFSFIPLGEVIKEGCYPTFDLNRTI